MSRQVYVVECNLSPLSKIGWRVYGGGAGIRSLDVFVTKTLALKCARDAKQFNRDNGMSWDFRVVKYEPAEAK